MIQDDNKLSIGFVVSHPFYGSPGSILRVRELVRSLLNFGVICHIYSPFEEKESWGKNVFFHHIPSLASTFRLQNLLYGLTRKVLNGRLSSQVVLRKRVLDRIIDSIAKGLLATMKNGEVDIIQGEQEIAAAACVRVKNNLKMPIIVSLHNIWLEELITAGIIDEFSEQYAILREIECEIIRDSDALVVVSEEMAKYLEQKYFARRDNVLVVPPGGRPRALRISSWERPFKIIFAGLVVPRGHVDLFVESMPMILEEYPDTKFYITQKGEALPRICKLAKKLRVNPTYYWYPSSEKFYEFLASCHVGVLPSSNDTPRRIGPATKLFDYLSVGLPVVANDIGGWVKIIGDEKVGVLTEDKPKSFAEGVLKLIKNKELAEEYRRRGLELVRNRYNWDNSAKILLRGYEQLLS